MTEAFWTGDKVTVVGFPWCKTEPKDVGPAAIVSKVQREMTPTKGETARAHDRRAMEMFARHFGRARTLSTLTRRDWDDFIRARRSGRLRAQNSTVPNPRERSIEQDCRLLRTIMRWAVQSRYIGSNPFAGLEVPREIAPRRARLSREHLAAILTAARSAGPTVHLFTQLAYGTGHRAASVRQLRWTDVDLTEARIRWRAENDKIGYEHSTVIPDELVSLLRAERERRPDGSEWVFPSRREPSKPMTADVAHHIWRKLARSVQVPQGERYGWHSMRRAFATEMKHTPLKDLCVLGGWKSSATVVNIYQEGDEATQRKAMASRAMVQVVG